MGEDGCVGQQDQVSKFVQAKDIIKSTFAADPDFRRTYVDNVSVLIMDRMKELKPIPTWEDEKIYRDKLASDIIKMVCE